jgi:hypothetical protein
MRSAISRRRVSASTPGVSSDRLRAIGIPPAISQPIHDRFVKDLRETEQETLKENR